MIDKKYIGKLDAQDKRWYDFVLYTQHKGNESAALDNLLYWMDCSVIYPNNIGRRCQTVDYGYRRDIAGYLYILDKITYSEDIRDKYYNKLVNRHEENLSFEEHNPPVHYSKQPRTSSRSSTRTAKITDMFTGKESTVDVGSGKVIKPKENAATRKAKALKDKSISFAFNNFKVNK